jgi:tetratricopeptide (TPR) repeat protein
MMDIQRPTREVATSSFPDYQAIFLALTDNQFVPFFQPFVTLRTGQIGAFYNAMKQTDTSISYLERAVALAPNDAMDNWNLGRAYDFSGQDDLAETYYSKSIALDPAGKDMPERNCIYAYFVEKKLHDKDRACMLQRAACEVEHQTACAVTPPPSAAAMPGTAHP